MAEFKTLDLVYHYTSLHVLAEIVRTRQLRLFDATTLNDAKEIEWAYDRLADAVRRNRQLYASLEIEIALPRHRSRPQYVPQRIVCFSEQPDDLSQWRGYGNDGTGVAIGFRFSGPEAYFPEMNVLAVHSRLYMGKVLYDGDGQAQHFDNMLAALNDAVLQQHGDLDADAVLQTVECVAPYMKCDAFQPENEWRMVRPISPNWYVEEIERRLGSPAFDGGYQVRDDIPSFRRGKTVDYTQLTFPDQALQEVRLGPRCGVPADEVLKLIAACGYRHQVAVVPSNLPYR